MANLAVRRMTLRAPIVPNFTRKRLQDSELRFRSLFDEEIVVTREHLALPDKTDAYRIQVILVRRQMGGNVRIWTVAALVATVALAEKSTNSSGDYTMDLGQVYGGIRATKMLEEICSKDFPNTRASNQRAYEQWRSGYLPFVQEMERHFSAMALREAKNDPEQHVAVLSKMEKSFDGYKDGLRQQVASGGPEAFRKQCQSYPGYLKSQRMNLESYYSEQVATIRRGPK